LSKVEEVDRFDECWPSVWYRAHQRNYEGMGATGDGEDFSYDGTGT